MANSINWGKVYCDMETNSSWGADKAYTTESIPDFSAPTCWSGGAVAVGFTADTTSYKADTILYKADATQI